MSEVSPEVRNLANQAVLLIEMGRRQGLLTRGPLEESRLLGFQKFVGQVTTGGSDYGFVEFYEGEVRNRLCRTARPEHMLQLSGELVLSGAIEVPFEATADFNTARARYRTLWHPGARPPYHQGVQAWMAILTHLSDLPGLFAGNPSDTPPN